MDQRQRNVLLGAVAVIALVVAGWMFSSSGEDLRSIDQYTDYCACLNCDWEGLVTHSSREQDPFICEQCDHESVHYLYYCNECRSRFIPQLIRGSDGKWHVPRGATCISCESADVSTYLPFFHEDQYVGDIIRPKLPEE